ncbi:hypothetical protein TRFO_21834 [Tritrichomonas foetus]|uniref:Uncharacterized protein n=1 Tax=Tritrichomonas foetus TaxID=1144522 RepID=A0A1J4KCX3_9EUKA|nr:hypothetical protein TRFO_21834 [Tritrichomonas foetus]|eukprot:OHT09273.1 hypothetical protein TRFO_21834 [Tritrichomonas foetus]
MFFLLISQLYAITVNVNLPVRYSGTLDIYVDRGNHYSGNYQKPANGQFSFSRPTWSAGTIYMTITIQGSCSNTVVVDEKFSNNPKYTIDMETLKGTKCEVTQSRIEIQNGMTETTLTAGSTTIAPGKSQTITVYNSDSISVYATNQYCTKSFVGTASSSNVNVYTDKDLPDSCVAKKVTVKNDMTYGKLLIGDSTIESGKEKEIVFGGSIKVYVTTPRCEKKTEIGELIGDSDTKTFTDADIPDVCKEPPEANEATKKLQEALNALTESSLTLSGIDKIKLEGKHYKGSASILNLEAEATSFSYLSLEVSSSLTATLKGPMIAEITGNGNVILNLELDLNNPVIPTLAVNVIGSVTVNVQSTGKNTGKTYLVSLGYLSGRQVSINNPPNTKTVRNAYDTICTMAGYSDIQITHFYVAGSCTLLNVPGNDTPVDPDTDTDKPDTGSSDKPSGDGTKVLKDNLLKLMAQNQEDLNLPAQGSETFDISGKYVKGTANQLALTLTAKELSVVKLTIGQGKVTLEGPIIAYINTNQNHIEVIGDAETKTIPMVQAEGNQITLTLNMKGKSKEPFLAAFGTVIGNQAVYNSGELNNRAFSAGEVGYVAGYSDVIFSELGDYQIVEVPKSSGSLDGKLPIIIGVVVAVVVVIIIIVVVVVVVKKKNKESSSAK